MRFYFDIHYDGKVDPDQAGEEFGSIEEARAYAFDTAQQFLRMGEAPNMRFVSQAIIEITDRHGLSEPLPMADLFEGRMAPRNALESAEPASDAA